MSRRSGKAAEADNHSDISPLRINDSAATADPPADAMSLAIWTTGSRTRPCEEHPGSFAGKSARDGPADGTTGSIDDCNLIFRHHLYIDTGAPENWSRILPAPGAVIARRKDSRDHVDQTHTIALTFCLLSSLTVGAQQPKSAGRTGTINPLPRDLEIQLALSSMPAHLRDQATVYVLNPVKGFEVARNGTNGFSALVGRTGDDAMRGAWELTEYPDDILYPVSWDRAGTGAQLRVFLDIAEMQANGTPSREVKKTIQQRYRANVYKAPERAGVAYMLSPILRTYTNPDADGSVATSNIPHVMHYAPNVSNDDVGAAQPTAGALRYYSQYGRWPASPSPFVILHGPHGYHVQCLGVTETAAITREYEGMLTRLCAIKKTWCLPKPEGSAR